MIDDGIRPPDHLGRAIPWSLGLHVAVAALLFTRAFFAPSDPLELEQAIRVDIVGLPQKILPDQAPPPPEPAPKPAAPKTAAPVPPPAPTPAPAPPKTEAPKFVEKPKPNLKHDQKDAFAKLRAMEALAKMKREAEEAAAAEARPQAPPAPIAGHKVTAGDSLSGVEKLDYNRYGADVRARVLANWRVPSWLAEADLRAKVRVWVDDTGAVTKKQIFLSSGNDVFDQAALDAVDASNPFPAPPDNLRGVLANEGFTLGLPK